MSRVRTCPACSSTRAHRVREAGACPLTLHGPHGGSVDLPWMDLHDALGHLVTDGVDPGAWCATCPTGTEIRDGALVLAVVTRGGIWRYPAP